MTFKPANPYKKPKPHPPSHDSGPTPITHAGAPTLTPGSQPTPSTPTTDDSFIPVVTPQHKAPKQTPLYEVTTSLHDHHQPLKYKLIIPLSTPDAPESSTCHSTLVDIIHTLFTKYQQEDPTCILLPWQVDSHQHPIYDPDSLPPHNDINAWDLYWSADPQLCYGRHSWLSFHWGYSKNHDNFAYPNAHKAWMDSHKTNTLPFYIQSMNLIMKLRLRFLCGLLL